MHLDILAVKEAFRIVIDATPKSILMRIAMEYIVKHGITCDYFGCNQPICKEDKKLQQSGSWRLCEKHAKERDDFVEREDVCGMLRWWATSESARFKAAKDD